MAISSSKSISLTAPSVGKAHYTLTSSFTETAYNTSSNTSTISVTGSLAVDNSGSAFSGATATLSIYWYDNNSNSSGRLLGSLSVPVLSSGSKSITKSITITHKDDGSLNGYAKAVWTKSSSNGYIPASGNVSTNNIALTKIPRKSEISVSKYGRDITDNIILIDISRKLSSYTDTLSWTCGSLSETLQTKGSTTKIALCFDDYVYNNTSVPSGYTKQRSIYSNTDLMNLIPTWSDVTTNPNQTITFTCTTYNGNTSLGSNSVGFKYEIYKTPFYNNLSYEVTDSLSRTLTGATDVVIKGISNMQVTNNPLKYSDYQDNVVANTYLFSGASMGEVTQVSNTYTFNKMLGAIVRSVVTDARGQSTSLSQSPIVLDSSKFLDYFTPIISELKTQRAESTSSDITINVKGNFWNSNFGASQNQINLRYRYKLDNDNYSSYISVNPTISQNEFTFEIILQGNSDKQLTIEFVVSDSTNSEFSLTATEPKGSSIFDMGDGYFNVNGVLARNGVPVLEYEVLETW